MFRIILTIIFIVSLNGIAAANELTKFQKSYEIFVKECTIALADPLKFATEELGVLGKFKLDISQDKAAFHLEKKISDQIIYVVSNSIAGKRSTHCSGWQGGVKNLSILIEQFKKWIQDLKLETTGGLLPTYAGDGTYVLNIYGSMPDFNIMTKAHLSKGSVGFVSEIIIDE